MYVCGDTVHHASTLDAAVVVDKGQQQYHVNYEFCLSKLTEHFHMSGIHHQETSTISADLLFVHACRSLWKIHSHHEFPSDVHSLFPHE